MWKLIVVLALATLVLLSPPVGALRFNEVNTIMVNTTCKVFSILRAIPYDHGVVVVYASGPSFTGVSLTPSYPLNVSVDFVNSNGCHVLLNSTFSNVHRVLTTVKGGELYVMVQYFYEVYPGGPYKYFTVVYVFQGLKLVSDYTVTGYYSVKTYNSPYYNLTVVCHSNAANGSLRENVSITINDVKYTLTNADLKYIEELPQCVLLVSEVGSIHGLPELDFMLINYTGKVVWSKDYVINGVPFGGTVCCPCLPLSAVNFFDTPESYIVTVGGELFIANESAPSSNFVAKRDSTVNVTVLALDLYNGDIVGSLRLFNVSPLVSLNVIGDSLYVSMLGSSYFTVEKYNGRGLVEVVKVPIEVKASKYGPYVLTGLYYSPSNYLLVVNYGTTLSNITDIYSGGITQYTVNGGVVWYQPGPDLLLLNQSNYYNLLLLNNNGTSIGSIYIGPISTRYIPPWGLPPDAGYPRPNVLAVSIPGQNSTDMYIIKVVPLQESSGQGQSAGLIEVYHLALSGGVSTYVQASEYEPVLIFLVLVALIVGVALIVAKRR
ncbi:hypothetical protein [Stygiolobus caldivivus]|nr:hypothetical protein [Stygiolobus caldivivus]